MAITQHAALWHKFVEVVAEYRGAQADYCDRCENQMIRQLLIINPNVAEQDLHDLLKQNKLYLFTDPVSTPFIPKPYLYYNSTFSLKYRKVSWIFQPVRIDFYRKFLKLKST